MKGNEWLLADENSDEWPFVYKDLLGQSELPPQIDRAELLRKGHKWLQMHEDCDGWSFVWQRLLGEPNISPEIDRAELLRDGYKWLQGREAHKGWAFVCKQLLDEPSLPPRIDRAEFLRRTYKWLSGREDQSGWSSIWHRLWAAQDLPPEVDHDELLMKGNEWLLANKNSDGWPFVYKDLLGQSELPPQIDRAELLRKGHKWLQMHEDCDGWSFVWQRLLETESCNSASERLPQLLASGLRWLKHPLNQSRGEWDKLLEQLLDTGGGDHELHETASVWIRRHADQPQVPTLSAKVLYATACPEKFDDLAIWLSDWIITHPDNSQARLTLRVLSPVFAGKEATEYVGLSGWSALHICWNESQRILQELQRLLTEGGRYWGRIASREKGGFLVELREPDITAFLPKSQADVRKPTDWNSYIGVECNFEIIGVDEWNQRPTVSRRLPLEKEQAAHLMALREGDRVGGVVVNLVGYGAFVTLNCGLTGLLHLSEFSWTEKYSDPAELLQIGQQVNVLILSVDFERRHIALSLRQLQPDPWMDIEGRVRVGCVVEGTVQSLTKKLAFIEIEPGVRGVVHVSHLSWTYRPKNSDEMLRVGQSVRCLVLSLDAESRKMELGLRELEVDPWLEKIPREYTVGDIRLGKVCNVVKYGVFVELERDLHGLLHRSEIPGESDGTEKIERHFESGEQLRVRIVAIDQGTRKIELSLMLDP